MGRWQSNRDTYKRSDSCRATRAILVAKLTAPAKSGPSDNEGDGNETSVLVTPHGRLQISADLDVKGIGKLKQMLEQYEQILKLLQ